MKTETLVTVKEAAKALGISTSSLYRMSRSKVVESYSVGPSLSGIRFSIPELREALRRRAHCPQSTGSIAG